MLGRPLRAVDVGFKIGPRINAAGRLSSAETAIDLFAATSEESAWTLCAELDRLNAERQEVERGGARGGASCDGCERRSTRIASTSSPATDWHKGVLGLTAGRIAQRYHRPTLAIGDRGRAGGRLGAEHSDDQSSRAARSGRRSLHAFRRTRIRVRLLAAGGERRRVAAAAGGAVRGVRRRRLPARGAGRRRS